MATHRPLHKKDVSGSVVGRLKEMAVGDTLELDTIPEITNAKLANAAANTLKANITGSAASPTDVAVADLTEEAAPASGDFVIGMLDTGEIRKIDIDNLPGGTPADDSITNAKLANVATDTIKGRTTAGTGDPEDMTPAQVRTMLNVADGATENANALETDLSAQISALTEKVSPVSGDHLLIEDSAASNSKKRVQVGNLPSGTPADDSITNAKLANVSGFTLKGKPDTGTGDPSDVAIGAGDLVGRIDSGDIQGITEADLTEEATPAAGDFLLGWESGGGMRKFDVGDLPSGGGSGDVTGPASSVDARLATFDGTTGKAIQDSGTLVSDLQATSEKAAANGYAGLDSLGMVPIAQQRPIWWDKIVYHIVKTPGYDAVRAFGMADDPTVDGTRTSDDSSNGGSWLTLDTAATSGSNAGVETTYQIIARRWLPTCQYAIKTGSSIANVRFWVGMVEDYIGETAAVADTAAFTLHGAAFSYDTGTHGTAFWRTHTCDGANAEVQTTTTAIAVSTTYNLRIVASASDVEFYINDTLVSTHSTTIPAIGSLMGHTVRLTTLTTSSKSFQFKRLDVIHD